MKTNKFFPVFILCLTALLTRACSAMEGGSQPNDPLIRMNYENAFDQSAIHQQFKPLMEQWGCASNVFGRETKLPADEFASDEPAIDDQNAPLLESKDEVTNYTSNNQAIVPMQEDYACACHSKLHAARRWALTEEAREGCCMINLLGGATILNCLALPANSMGSSFGCFAFLFNSAQICRPIIRSCFNWHYPPSNVLGDLEERFAQTQCFIPKTLWPIIINKFAAARTNQFEQRSNMDFIEFVLGLTMYKPRPTVLINEEELASGMQNLFLKIDQFFKEYEANDQASQNLWMLKNNIAKFIRLLLGDHTQTIRYLYLHGLGGIGKTHFINKLSQWVEELIPGSVRFENLNVSTSDELEGSSSRPGVMLRVLRNQLMANKRGSVVFLDEATWLNKEDMVSTSKRVFNGDQSQISTSYFGDGVEGTGIALKTSPMLIFVASNEKIKDPALKTRFDTIQFPMPKKGKLLSHARNIANNNKLIQDKRINLSKFNFEEWLEKSEVNNFRDVESQVVSAILSTHKD